MQEHPDTLSCFEIIAIPIPAVFFELPFVDMKKDTFNDADNSAANKEYEIPVHRKQNISCATKSGCVR